jgi:hypothetical protein
MYILDVRLCNEALLQLFFSFIGLRLSLFSVTLLSLSSRTAKILKNICTVRERSCDAPINYINEENSILPHAFLFSKFKLSCRFKPPEMTILTFYDALVSFRYR